MSRREKFLSWYTPLFFFLLPWQARWIFFTGTINQGEWGTLSFFATEVLALPFFCLSLFALRKSEHRALRLFTLMMIFIGLFFILHSSIPLLSLQQAMRLFLVCSIAFVLSHIHRETKRYIMIAFLWSMAIQALLALWQITAGMMPANTFLGTATQFSWQGMSSVVETSAGRILRGYGTFPHPNIFGLACVIAWFCGWQLLRTRWQMVIPLALCSAGVLFSFSRSAWLAFALVIAVVVWSERKFFSHAHTIALAVTASTIIALLIPLAPFVFGRVQVIDRLEQRSLHERSQSLLDGWHRVQVAPFFGSGLGVVLSEKNALSPQQPAHLVPLEIVAEVGIVGALFFLAGLWRVRKKITLPFLVLIAPGFLLDHYFWTLWPGLLLFISICFLEERQTT